MTLATLAAPFLFLVSNVIVVGPGPGQLPDIQSAIDASVDGDVVLVKSGTYLSFVVTNRTLTIAADAGATVDVVGAIRVRNLAASRSVVVSGLLARGISGSPTFENVHGAYVGNCAGPVTFQDCGLYGFWNGSSCEYTPGHGALVESSAAVVFERTALEGTALYRGDASLGPDGNADGLRATSSSIALYSSTSVGGGGGIACLGYAGDGMNGGEGADFSACTVVAQDTSFWGGSGQSGWDGGDGGHGMVLRTGPSVVRSYGSSYAGGSEGQGNPACWFCYDGYPGVPIANWSNSIVTTVPGLTRDFVAPAVTRENTQAALVSRGLGNDLVVLRISLTPGFAVEPPWNGVATTVASTTPERFLIVGTINGPTLAYTLPVGTVPASSARVLRLQSLHLAADGTRWLGDPRTLVVLDSIY